jgi:predicted CoA-binding protein
MGFGSSAVCDIALNTALTAAQRDRYQNPDVIRDVLEQCRTIAMVGLSADRQKASYFVASYLRYEGYRVIPVNPRGGDILGQHVYPDLRSIPEPVDLVDVFRPASECSAIVDQAIAIRAQAVWTQLRITDFGAAEKALAAGLKVVMDRCVKMEHGRYGGSLHWAGMNTEIVTARKPHRLVDSTGGAPRPPTTGASAPSRAYLWADGGAGTPRWSLGRAGKAATKRAPPIETGSTRIVPPCREMENAIERAVVLAETDTLFPGDLPPSLRGAPAGGEPSEGTPKPRRLEDVEREHILGTLDAYAWNQARAAEALGIGRNTLWRKLKDYGVTPPERPREPE